MQKIIKYLLIIFVLLNFKAFAKENFFQEAKNLFDKGKIEESKFLFQRNIVFNPKDSKSYLYLAKIFESEENEVEEEKNINTTLLLDPENEEAMYMLIDIKLEKSDIKKVEQLREKGLIKGGSLSNAVVILDRRIENGEINHLRKLFGIKDKVIQGTNGILNGKVLRFHNEPVRHKTLDLIGDLALLGISIKGHVTAARSGHESNVEFVKMIKKEYKEQLENNIP